MGKKKRAVPKINYVIRQFEDFETITEQKSVRKMIYDNLIDAIKYSIQNNKKDADVVQIYETDCILSLDKSDWTETLNEAINFYAADDDYDKCIEIQNIIKKYNKK